MVNKQRLRPIIYEGLERVGSATGDGGYVVPAALLDAAEVVLSLGLGREWTFDVAARRRNPKAVMVGVDHTISPWWFARAWLRSLVNVAAFSLVGYEAGVRRYRALHDVSRSYFWLFRGRALHLRQRVAAEDGPRDVSLDTLLRRTDAAKPHSVFVKMDIEGTEYDVIPALCRHHGLIQTIAAEFHDVTSAPERFDRGISQLLEHFRIVHIHGNNYGPYSAQDDFPDVVEITLVHESLCPKPERPSLRSYPVDTLDVPNDPAKPDYALRFGPAGG